VKNGRKLGKDEKLLWGKVARTVRPYTGKAEDFDFELELDNDEQNSTATGGLMAGNSAQIPRLVIEAVELELKTEQRKTRQFHPLERPIHKKLAKGRLPIDAKIDLHGMVQSQAHDALYGFLCRTYAQGFRHVLIVTGKGRSMGSEGALKRVVPIWFGKPEFRMMISSYHEAAINHGGAGALYVRLARQKGEPL
jgi:DNA-nicking Smr family endonuclease